MKLASIKIQNFRSVLNEELIFNENCLGLIDLMNQGKAIS